MSINITTLDNGLRVITDHMEHLATTSLGVWIASGSCDESADENGLSHLLEHMAFKGTEQRSARDIAEEIEALGGELNAATGHETTAYYARVLTGDEAAALRILADILQHPTFADEDLARERDVILQEIAATQDNPEDIVFDDFHAAAYPDQPLGRPILGTETLLQSYSSADLRRFLGRHYNPDQMIVSAAGGVRHDSLVRHVEALFQAPNSTRSGGGRTAQYSGGVAGSDKPFEQCHVAIGFEGPSYCDDAYFAAQVMSGIYGGGMSSRLFQEVREKRGLCYSIYSSVWGLANTGMFYLHSATAPEALKELTGVIADEFSGLCNAPPKPDELQRAKAQLKVGLLGALESSAARAEQMARHLMAYGRVISKDDLIARVDQVSGDDVLQCARRIAASAPTISIAGCGPASTDYAAQAASLFTSRAFREAV